MICNDVQKLIDYAIKKGAYNKRRYLCCPQSAYGSIEAYRLGGEFVGMFR